MTLEEMWLSRVRAWRASGLTAAQFCEDQPYETASLQSWSSRLGRKGKVAPSRPGRRSKRSASPPGVQFARVVTSAALSSSTPASPRATGPVGPRAIVVSVGGTRIELTPGFDPSLLRSVVEALSEASP